MGCWVCWVLGVVLAAGCCACWVMGVLGAGWWGVLDVGWWLVGVRCWTLLVGFAGWVRCFGGVSGCVCGGWWRDCGLAGCLVEWVGRWGGVLMGWLAGCRQLGGWLGVLVGWLCAWASESGLIDGVAGWLGGAVVGWLAGCVAGWLGGVLAGWLAAWVGRSGLAERLAGQRWKMVSN